MFIGILLLVGGLPVFAQISGYYYLPAPNWVAGGAWIARGLGVFLGGASFWLMMRTSEKNGDAKGFKFVALIFIVPLFGYGIGSMAVMSGGPMVAAIVVGDTVEIQYEIKNAEGWGDSKCRRPIRLKGLSSFNNKLCHFPDDFRQTLSPGSQVIVEGRGTRFGVFTNLARRVH